MLDIICSFGFCLFLAIRSLIQIRLFILNIYILSWGLTFDASTKSPVQTKMLLSRDISKANITYISPSKEENNPLECQLKWILITAQLCRLQPPPLQLALLAISQIVLLMSASHPFITSVKLTLSCSARPYLVLLAMTILPLSLPVCIASNITLTIHSRFKIMRRPRKMEAVQNSMSKKSRKETIWVNHRKWFGTNKA